jgi:YHS domain-containing protein
MQTLAQIQACEGYYFDAHTGDIVRNVGPGAVQCWREGSWLSAERLHEWDEPRFQLLTRDISVSFQVVKQSAESRFPGRVSRTIVNRQTARQSDERLVTEEAVTQVPPPASEPDDQKSTIQKSTMETKTIVNDVVCGTALKPDQPTATSEYQGLTYYFCAPRCKEEFDRQPERYASKWIKEIRGPSPAGGTGGDS